MNWGWLLNRKTDRAQKATARFWPEENERAAQGIGGKGGINQADAINRPGKLGLTGCVRKSGDRENEMGR